MKTASRPPDIEPYLGKPCIKGKVPVNQYGLDGKWIKTFESIWDAHKSTHIHTSSISACCKGRYKTAGGYQWRKALT